MGPKIATCCYCGTRATLVLDRARHALSCSNCGAPLREMKSLPSSRLREAPEPVRSAPRKQSKPPERYRKKRKSMGRRLLSEVWDAVEDIFD